MSVTKLNVEVAVAAAGRAYKGWGIATAYEERREQTRVFLGALEREREGFLKCMIREGGKPVSYDPYPFELNTTWEVLPRKMRKISCPTDVLQISFHSDSTTAQSFIAAAEFDGTLTRSHDLACLNLITETIQETPIVHCLVRYYPLKVAAAIVPWNSPFHLLLVKLVPALLAGCPVIVKPSPHAPYTVLKVVELASRFFPKGVVQAVSGTEEVGAWLTSMEDVAKISFTGSVEAGKRIFESAATGMKRLTLEL